MRSSPKALFQMIFQIGQHLFLLRSSAFLLLELSPIGNDYRRLQALYKRLQDNGNTDAFRDDTSDGLEAVGGISGGSFREARV